VEILKYAVEGNSSWCASWRRPPLRHRGASERGTC
jgi:hypothetical protein